MRVRSLRKRGDATAPRPIPSPRSARPGIAPRRRVSAPRARTFLRKASEAVMVTDRTALAPSYLAIDLGASSGRAVVGTLDGDTMAMRELHRFPTPLVEDGA